MRRKSRAMRSARAAAAIRKSRPTASSITSSPSATASRVLFADSPGPITDAQRALAQKAPVVDVAMFPYYAFEAGLPPLVDLVKTFKPSTVFLGHHDSEGTMKWASNYPAALAIRDANPKTQDDGRDLPDACLLQHRFKGDGDRLVMRATHQYASVRLPDGAEYGRVQLHQSRQCDRTLN